MLFLHFAIFFAIQYTYFERVTAKKKQDAIQRGDHSTLIDS